MIYKKLFVVCIIFFIVVSFVYYCNKYISKSSFENYSLGNVKICKKETDNTAIKYESTLEWADHFCMKFKKNEPYTNLKLKELLKELPNNTAIIDVGAHVGDTGLYLALHLNTHYPEKNITVIMIEPDHSKVEFIKNTAKLNNLNNIVVFEKGVSDKTMNGSLSINKKAPGATRIKEVGDDIQIDTIDNICKDYVVSLMHIDVEGMEYKCLVGSEQTLRNVKYIMIELNSIVERNPEIKFLNERSFINEPNEKIRKEFNNQLFVRS